jgi:hypothetical protein
MASERGRGSDVFGVGVGTGVIETGRHHTAFSVEKWDLDQIAWVTSRDYDDLRNLARGAEPVAANFREHRCSPYETYVKEDCNLILDTGWQYIMNGFAGSAVTKFVNATTGRIGLGTSATAVAYADTALNAIGALTSHNWEVINAVPTVGASHTAGLVLAAQFPTGDANGVAIQEFGSDLGTVATLSVTPVGTFVSHGNATPGTKTSAQTWNATLTITWA